MLFSRAKKRYDITSGSILFGMLLFAIPLILSNILTSLFHTADAIMVGRWGGDTVEECEHALAAVGSCGALVSAITSLFTGLSTGSSVCAAREIGAKNSEEVGKTVSTSLWLSLICGLLCAGIGILFAEPLLSAMGTDPILLPTAAAYIRVYFLGVPAMMIYSFCTAILRAKGDTVRPLLFLTVGGVLNLALNAVTVLVLRMGAVGVATATAITQYVLLAVILVYMSRISGICRIQWSKLTLCRKKLIAILRIGIPSSAQGVLISASNVFTQSAINAYTPAFVAGNTAAANIETYLAVIQSSISQAGLVYVGQNLGAKDTSRVRKALLTGTFLAVGIGFAAGMIARLAAEPILNLFCPDNPAAIEAGMIRASIDLLPHFLYGTMIFGMAALRGLGKNILPTVLMLSGCGVYRICWLMVYNRFFLGNPQMLFLVYPTSWILSTIAVYASLWIVYRRVARRMNEETALLRE